MTTASAITHSALLQRSEIDALIEAATRPASIHVQRIRKGARSGDLTTRELGTGTDTADLRNYHPGDDIRHIDWRASARSGQTMLRTWHADNSNTFVMLLDRRATMRFGSRRRLKITQAARLAITLLAGAAQSGRSVGALILDHPGQWIPPAAGVQGMMRLIPALVSPAPPLAEPDDHGWQPAVSELMQRLDEDSEIALVSDFSAVGKMEEKLLQALGQRFRCRAFHVTDPLESDLNFPFPVTLSWAGQEFDIRSPDSPALTTLRTEQARFETRLRKTCLRAGIHYQQLMTTRDDLSTLP